MEDLKTTDSVAISASASGPSDIAHPHHQRPIPDVPEDIEDEVMPHFNDPNWDFRDNSSSLSVSNNGVAPQQISRISSHVDSGTEGPTESQIASWHIHDPNAHFSSESRLQLRILYFSLCILFIRVVFIRDSPYPEVRAAVANTDDPTMVMNTFRV
jgi:hypothetical protein